MKPSLSAYWRELASGFRTDTCGRLLLLLLVPCSLAYALILQLRATFYRIGVFSVRRLPRPVISVGNLTVGGTGKTPVTAHIARLLLGQGYRVAVLSRGYGGSLEGTCLVVSDGTTVMVPPEQCGDEPFLLATTVPGLMVVTGSDRHAAGMLAMEQLSPDVFLLDDGFQHLRLYRDLNILLLDGSQPYGSGWTLPAGLLREPVAAARRADLIIFTRCQSTPPPITGIAGIPAVASTHCLKRAFPLAGGNSKPLDEFSGLRILAFAGIAQPEYFFSGLQGLGLHLVQTISFPDHAAYDQDRLDQISEAVRASAADCAITTEKDGVKLSRISPETAAITYVARLDITFSKPAELQELLRNSLQKQ